MVELKVDIRPSRATSGVVSTPFDDALEELKRNNFELIPLSQNAELRFLQGTSSHISLTGNYVKEGVMSIPNKGIYLLRNSPLLQLELAKEAVISHRSREEYFFSEKSTKQYFEKISESQESEVFPLVNLEAINTDKFNIDKRALWLFGNQAEPYGRFLYDNGIKEMHLKFPSQNYINQQESSFINQLFFRKLFCGGSSSLEGYDKNLHYGGGVRGIVFNPLSN